MNNCLRIEQPLLAKRKSATAEGVQRPQKHQNENTFSPSHLFKKQSPKEKRSDSKSSLFQCEEPLHSDDEEIPCESASHKTPSPVKIPPENCLEEATHSEQRSCLTEAANKRHCSEKHQAHRQKKKQKFHQHGDCQCLLFVDNHSGSSCLWMGSSHCHSMPVNRPKNKEAMETGHD